MSAIHLEPSDLIEIPGGEFLMGQEDGRDEERSMHRVGVSPFRLCSIQVTNAHYDVFRKATMREKSEYRDRTEFAGPSFYPPQRFSLVGLISLFKMTEQFC
jgi:formylglycine-generating enzyme required for sulfatase activity